MQFSDFKYYTDNLPKDSKEQGAFFGELKKQFIEELWANPESKHFLSGFTKDSVDKFVEEYANHKIRLIQYQELYCSKISDSHKIEFHDDAEKVFEILLQKKLFNKQLLWRAEKIKIPEIRLAYDFVRWGQHIKACPFLDPIEPDEIMVLKEYLLEESKNVEDLTFLQSYPFDTQDWQDYDELMRKDEYDDREWMLEWYEFYDSHFGTGYLLDLPDIRGEKEEYYMEIYRESEREKAKNAPPKLASQPSVYVPSIWFFEKGEELFDKQEDKYFKYLQKGCQKVQKPYGDKAGLAENIEEAIDLLMKAKVPVYMTAVGEEWHDAIFRCAKEYQFGCIIELIDMVSEEYEMLQSLGITVDTKKKRDYTKSIFQIYNEGVLGGRKILGEPEDYDF